MTTSASLIDRPLDRHGFRIAIICGLILELEMIELVLDQNWTAFKYGKAYGDKNTYTTGSIASHPVVLAVCPRIGSNDAAAVATRLASSFTGIKVAFLVGVCGVVPVHPETHESVILGDCVISTAVVQYDMGKQYPRGFQTRKFWDSLGPAGPEIRGFTAMLSTRLTQKWLNERLNHHLQQLKTKYPDIGRPTPENDRLYNESYIHTHQSRTTQCDKCQTEVGVCLLDCNQLGCEEEQRISRQGISRNQPKVHFGIFGSANSVMKSGLHRNSIAKAERLSAFEMEGSGIWEVLPTVIIKSACDYADSHKDKVWQKYSAASAAACLKAVLERLELSDEQHTVQGQENK